MLDLSEAMRREKLMKLVPVEETWGIGSRIAARTVMELNGIHCQELEIIAPDKQQIFSSRSFSHRLTEYRGLSEALFEFRGRAAEKLRRQQSVTGHIGEFLRATPFNPNEPQFQGSEGLPLPFATQDTRVIISTANRMLKELFRQGYRHQKCGVQLSQNQPASALVQMDLLDSAVRDHADSAKLMKIMDLINQRFPRGIAAGAIGFDKAWKPKAERMSKRYTTDWQELLNIKC